MSVTNHTYKFVRSLAMRKYRLQHRCFVAEGPKAVRDLLPLMPCRILFAEEPFTDEAQRLMQAGAQVDELCLVSHAELERLSSLPAPRGAVAVFHLPEAEDDGVVPPEWTQLPARELCLALDGVQDPGNVGTIVRIADWFGIRHIFASRATADVFAPKVVQATMGAVGRVKVHYTDLPHWLANLPQGVPVCGTFLDGNNIYQHNGRVDHGVLVMGSEGQGITPEVEACVNARLLIPNYPAGCATSESLNVAVATAIVCGEWRRRLEADAVDDGAKKQNWTL